MNVVEYKVQYLSLSCSQVEVKKNCRKSKSASKNTAKLFLRTVKVLGTDNDLPLSWCCFSYPVPQLLSVFWPLYTLSDGHGQILLTSVVLICRVHRKSGAGLLWSLVVLFVSPCFCVSAGWQDVRPIWGGGGKPVILTCLLWFQSPHIPTYTLTHSAAAATEVAEALRVRVFHSETPVVTFSSTSHSFHLKLCTSRKGGCASLISWVVCLRVKLTRVSLFCCK